MNLDGMRTSISVTDLRGDLARERAGEVCATGARAAAGGLMGQSGVHVSDRVAVRVLFSYEQLQWRGCSLYGSGVTCSISSRVSLSTLQRWLQ